MWIKALFIEPQELLARRFPPEVKLLPQRRWGIFDHAVAVLVAPLGSQAAQPVTHGREHILHWRLV